MSETPPLHVAFLLPSLKFGGAERVAVNLARALNALGVTVDMLLLSHQGEFLAEAERYCYVVDLQCDRTYKLPGKLLAYMATRRPDVLLSSFWKLNLCACLARLLHWRIRLLLWEHSPPSKSKNSPRWLYAVSASVFYRMAHRVIAVSNGVHADVARWSVGLRPRLQVIFNPIEPPPPALASRVAHRQPVQQIVWVGRLDGPKNPLLALEAFALLPDKAVRLVFVGDGPLRDQLQQRCRDMGLSNLIMFHGFHPQPYEVMAISDLLLLTSDREGLPSVIVEAMFCGLPVVATDCGAGIHDILLNNRYGTIVAPRDPARLAAAIAGTLDKPCDRDAQISGAQRFLPQVIARQFLAVMNDERE